MQEDSKDDVTIKQYNMQILHYSEQCESGCLEWLEKCGFDGELNLTHLITTQLVELSNKEHLTDEECQLLVILQFSLHGLFKASDTLQARDDETFTQDSER